MLSDAIIETINIEASAMRLTDTILGSNGKDLSDTLKEIASEIGVSHISYVRFSPDKSEDTTLLTAIFTYSTDWTRRYFAKQYVNTDPVIAFGRDAVVPFDWETLVGDNPAVRAFFDDAANHGVGRNGLSIPVRNRRGIYNDSANHGVDRNALWMPVENRPGTDDDAANHGVGRNALSIPVENRRGISALVSFSGNQSKVEWAQYKSENMIKLQLLSVLIDSAANINFRLPSTPVHLSRREEQCLIWAARGKTYQEIADILELTFGSVKTHLDAARRKLHCLNLAHAVGVAIATGVIPAKALQW